MIEESIEILQWALEQQDPHGLLNTNLDKASTLITRNDNEFKYWLDRYKYFDRYPEHSQLEYREKGEAFIQELEELLANNTYLLGPTIGKADIAIMPFVRQFAHVDKDAFYQLPYPQVQKWLKSWLEHPIFIQTMKKYTPWQEGDEPIIFSFAI